MTATAKKYRALVGILTTDNAALRGANAALAAVNDMLREHLDWCVCQLHHQQQQHDRRAAA